MPRSVASVRERAASTAAEVAAVVRDGLSQRQKRLPAWLFYDPLGSSLFEAICQLPWYRITRAESGLLDRAAASVAASVGDPAAVVELGGGSGEKLARLLAAFEAVGRRPGVHLVDVSERALDLAARTVGEFAGVRVTLHQATYEEGLARVKPATRGTSTLVLFLGSNLGNFDPPEALALVRRVAAMLKPGDAFLLGTDLVKPERDLQLAYDDPLGVTAAFNLNVLQRLNTELSADFDLAAFRHEARWNAAASRVEMHLVSTCAQAVTIPGAGLRVTFEAGESIWTESSYKYDQASIDALFGAAGLARARQWTDDRAHFALTLARLT